MKKILSVLFLALLGVTTIEAADFYAHAAAKVATEAQGMGTVCVTTTNATPATGWSDLSSVFHAFAGDANSATYNFYYHAKANEGYYFAGWSATDGGSEMGTEKPHATGTTSGTQAAPNTEAPTYYAMFKPYLHVIQHDKMIRYVNQDGDENINNSVIIVEAKETNISFALNGANNGLFALVNPQTAQKAASLTVPAKQGLAQVELQYLGDFNDAIGKTVDIVVTAGSRTTTLTTTIEDMPTLTFLPTKSNYTVTHTNGTGVTYTVNQASPTVTQITEEGMLTVELALTNTTNGEYAFLGWQEITNDANGNEIVKYISYDKNCVYTFNGSAQVRPEFVHCSVATFYIEAQKNLPYASGYTLNGKIAYHDFALVMHDAEELYHLTGEAQVVIFESIYNIYKIKGYTRPSAVTAAEEKVGTLASGNYTIPKGVTLLIPGNDTRTCRIGDADTNGADHQSGSGFTNKRKLNLSDGTKINVSGNLSVYAEMSYNQPNNGQPVTYGWITMGKNTQIVAESGAVITCYGYITGNPDNSSVTIKNGARIHESFQLKDWRGGAAALGMITSTSNKVFPIQQYYVQSVETRLILECGAIERISTAANITGVGEVYPSANFVVPEGNTESALFKLGEGASLVKYYDISTDRLKILFLGNKSGSTKATAAMEGIQLNISSYPINSADYVLPLNNNIDVSLYNIDVTIINELAFLAGSSLYVDAQSKVLVNDNVFVYDGNEHVVTTNPGLVDKLAGAPTGTYNYFGASNSYLCPLTKRPGNIQYSRGNYKGTQSGNGYYHNTDTKWVIDGVVEGKVYTTIGGAEITSNGGGKIKVTSGSNVKLKQAVQYTTRLKVQSVVYGDILNSLAKLKHKDGTYLSSTSGNTYVYDAAQGKWIQNGTTTPVVDEKDYTPTFNFNVATPFAMSAYVGKTATANVAITTTNANVDDWTKVDWSYQITGLSANQFTSSAVTTSGCTVTFAPTSAGSSKTATLKIIASYVKNQKLYTYTKEVALTGTALANANDLDFAVSSIASAQKSLFVRGNGAAITIDNAAAVEEIVTLTPSSDNTSYTIQAMSGVNDAITIHATQAETSNVQGTTISKIITVGGGKQALPVTLEVKADNFDRATWAKSSSVAFNNGVVMLAHSQWTVFFSGTPDKVKFTPTTTSTWQVEEFDGKGWNVLHSWATIPANKEFALQLTPSTSKVRIRCANGGTLSNVVITALKDSYVTANVDTLFIPKVTEGDTYTTSVLLNYMAEDLVTISTSNVSLLSLSHTVLDPAVDGYKQQSITLTSSVQEPGEYRMTVRVGAAEKIIIPIIVYEQPQMLPIMLKSDADKYRYYYVTPVSQHATWNAKDRTITLKNKVGSSAPSLTFAFEGAPTYISFTPSSGYKGTWHIEQSADAQTWWDASVATEKHSENTHEFEVKPVAQYIRVTYESYYAEEVTLSNLMIVGEPSVIVEPLEMEITKGTPEKLTITAVNLSAAPTYNFSDPTIFGIADVSTTGTIAANSVATIIKNISYTGDAAIAYGTLTISYGSGKSVVVNLVGLSKDLNTATGIWTGVDKDKYSIDGSFDAYDYHEVNIANAYDNGKTLFDYLVIYGETQPEMGDKITKVTSTTGSNAVTPCFIYEAKDDRSGYELLKYEKNTNTAFKVLLGETDEIEVDGQLDIYMTGFCPYASTGYTKAFEGVWYFKGNAGETVNVYLEECHIYSRNKTEDGHPFQSKADGNSFTESYVRGSGGVLVFACDEMSNVANPFKVNIHTRGKNVLKSNHGCFYDILGYRAYQVSSPIQIRMVDDTRVSGSATELTFDDIWPNTTNRTNGYLALKKQVNNAPSIDMGNRNTVVNFRGGQIHLENAQIVSENYQTTLAICYRSGKMGGIEFPFAHGIGTDDVGGTVKFYDGTTTVERMKVDTKYRQYYLMDDDGEYTSCLRCPTKTFIYGGSHGMIRACQHTTSKGGAPSDGTNKLGRFEYTLTANDVVDANSKLATIKDFPNSCLATYYATAAGYENKTYSLNSVTPIDGKLIFWVPDICDDYNVTLEEDKNTLYWSACMTKISAEVSGQGGSVGGETFIDDNTEVQNLLYCKIDDDIYDAIADQDYQAPVKIPSTSNYERIPISVEKTENEGLKVYQNYITNENDYTIQNKIYYVTTATADMWMTFTPPFDVEKVYVIETYSEKELQKVKSTDPKMTKRKAVMKEQAKHNADFAAFYGVAMAIYNKSSIDFWDNIFADYLTWAKQEDKNVNTDADGNPLYTGGEYNLRDRYLLQHYDGTNAASSNYYLYENAGNWTIDNAKESQFTVQWRIPDESDGVLMNKGVAYSMLFPYCTGCGAGNPIEDREFWDYWSGKFIIFESVAGATIEDAEGNAIGHTIKGSNFVAATDPNSTADGDWVFEDFDDAGTDAIVTGNSTFSLMSTTESELYVYQPDVISYETFYRNVDYESDGKTEKEQTTSIHPTTAFLLATPAPQGNMPARSISRTGEINYGKQNTPTGNHGGNIPTVGGGNDLFITSTATGINIAVAEPQQVRVMSATGAIIYSGMVQTAVDVALPTTGVYVVAGENEVHKILH